MIRAFVGILQAEDSPNKAFADERGSIELLLKGGKDNYAEAMLRTIKLYKIDMSHNGKVITPEIRLDLPSEDMVTTGKLFLGRGAFVNGAGYLGSTIQHEMVHVRFGSLYFDFQGDTLNRMEVEAYKHEIQNSNRFGLTYNQVIELKKLKNGYCSAISSSYRSEMGYSC